jgi:hypothetical protein
VTDPLLWEFGERDEIRRESALSSSEGSHEQIQGVITSTITPQLKGHASDSMRNH